MTHEAAPKRNSLGAVTPDAPHFRYRFLKTLGHGAFGKVRLSENTDTGELVAIKVLDKSRLSDGKDIARVEQEIRMLTLLRHPNIARLHEVFSSERHIYMVLEHCEGGELFDYIVQNGQLPEGVACSMFRQLVSAVAYCHANFIVHRDLKPENILLDQHMNLRIVDFGLASSWSQGRKLTTSCGSPAYCAPEMLTSPEYDGPKVDVWSLGVVLYAMVTGCLPFGGDDVSALFASIKEGRYDEPTSQSPAVRDLIHRMLVVDAAKRASLREVMSHEWVTMPHSLPPPTHLPLRSPIDQVDQSLVEELGRMGLNEDDVTAAVQAGRPSPLLSCYYLLEERRLFDRQTRPHHPRPPHSHHSSRTDSATRPLSPNVTASPKTRSRASSLSSSPLQQCSPALMGSPPALPSPKHVHLLDPPQAEPASVLRRVRLRRRRRESLGGSPPPKPSSPTETQAPVEITSISPMRKTMENETLAHSLPVLDTPNLSTPPYQVEELPSVSVRAPSRQHRPEPSDEDRRRSISMSLTGNIPDLQEASSFEATYPMVVPRVARASRTSHRKEVPRLVEPTVVEF